MRDVFEVEYTGYIARANIQGFLPFFDNSDSLWSVAVNAPAFDPLGVADVV